MNDGSCAEAPASQSHVGLRWDRYVCEVCGFVYDEALGLPDDGIPPGTRWNEIPVDFVCPDCGMAKADFVMALVDA